MNAKVIVVAAFSCVVMAGWQVQASAANAEDDGFKELKKTKDGVVVSTKPGRTKGFNIVRFDASSPVAPAALADFLWKSFETNHPPVAERRFLKKEPGEIVFYDKIKTPVVSDRDYTMRIRRVSEGDSRKLVFQTVTEFGPPPDPDYVRMPITQGAWEMSPDPNGGSIVRYWVYSEPGGSVPAWIIRDPQVKEALEDFRRALKDAAKGP
jgi:hypothetical protein